MNNNYLHLTNKNFIDNSFIAGEDISLSIVKSLSEAVGLDFKLFNPFEKIKADTNLYQNKCFLEKYNSFSPAAGIALRIA